MVLPGQCIINMYTQVLVRANLSNGYTVNYYRPGVTYSFWVKLNFWVETIDIDRFLYIIYSQLLFFHPTKRNDVKSLV